MYAIENRAGTDYKIERDTSIRAVAKVRDELSSCGDCVTVERPLFIPAGQKGTFAVELKGYRIGNLTEDQSTKAGRGKTRKLIAEYLTSELPDLNGFVVFDEGNHFRMDLPPDREELILELQEALSRVKTLKGLLPICAVCKNIRDDQGYWNHIESYVREHSHADFTHGICPACAKRLYPEEWRSAS